MMHGAFLITMGIALVAALVFVARFSVTRWEVTPVGRLMMAWNLSLAVLLGAAIVVVTVDGRLFREVLLSALVMLDGVTWAQVALLFALQRNGNRATSEHGRDPVSR